MLFFFLPAVTLLQEYLKSKSVSRVLLPLGTDFSHLEGFADTVQNVVDISVTSWWRTNHFIGTWYVPSRVEHKVPTTRLKGRLTLLAPLCAGTDETPFC